MSLTKPVITRMDPEMQAKLAILPQPFFGPTSLHDYVDRFFGVSYALINVLAVGDALIL